MIKKKALLIVPFHYMYVATVLLLRLYALIHAYIFPMTDNVQIKAVLSHQIQCKLL